jgi:invasion protein IalB
MTAILSLPVQAFVLGRDGFRPLSRATRTSAGEQDCGLHEGVDTPELLSHAQSQIAWWMGALSHFCSAGLLFGSMASFLLGLVTSSVVQAETAPAIQRFGDWEVTCETLPQGAQEAASAVTSKPACKVVQRLTVKGTDETVFLVTLLPQEKAGPVAIVSVPLGGYLVPGIEVTVDGKKPYKLLIETCTATGCHAGFPLVGQVSKDLRTGKSASFRVWSSKSQSSDVKVSLKGFADAMASLERRP